MRDILKEIQSGDFAREWIAENRAGQENFKRMRAEQADTQVEKVGKDIVNVEFETIPNVKDPTHK